MRNPFKRKSRFAKSRDRLRERKVKKQVKKEVKHALGDAKKEK